MILLFNSFFSLGSRHEAVRVVDFEGLRVILYNALAYSDGSKRQTALRLCGNVQDL